MLFFSACFAQSSALVTATDQKVDSIERVLSTFIRFDTVMAIAFFDHPGSQESWKGRYTFYYRKPNKLFKISGKFLVDSAEIHHDCYYLDEQLLRMDMHTPVIGNEPASLVRSYWKDFELKEMIAPEKAGSLAKAELYYLSLISFRQWQIAWGTLRK